MDKPTKPTDLVPRSFGGVKNNFSSSLQASGYEDGVPAIYGGDNLNYQLDATGKELDYCEKIVDFINGIPIGKTVTVDVNNKLIYDNLAQELPIATTSEVGVVKPDGESILVDENGVISVNTSDFANTDLDNLTSIGVDNLIKYAYEPDWDNYISVTTSSDMNTRTYTAPDDGIFYVRASVSGAASVRTINARIYSKEYNNTHISSDGFVGTWQSMSASVGAQFSRVVQKNEVITYIVYGSGTTVDCHAEFVPFKKSLT